MGFTKEIRPSAVLVSAQVVPREKASMTLLTLRVSSDIQASLIGDLEVLSCNGPGFPIWFDACGIIYTREAA
jgi:hypothetical protein